MLQSPSATKVNTLVHVAVPILETCPPFAVAAMGNFISV
jgi:hypothetical protein